MTMQTVSLNKSHGGVQGVYKHASGETGTDMTFSVYVPPHQDGARLPVVWYLSGLTCTHANVTEKGEFRSACAELGLIFVAPDTSPRGEKVPGDPASAYDFGLGAGFYVDATQEPFARNYRMWSYVTEELPKLVAGHFPADAGRQSILGHSMGGHGALTAALRHPDRYRAASAFAPIVAPSQVPWGIKALGGYLGDNKQAWRRHDAVALIEDGARFSDLLVDYGDADTFLTEQLRPELLKSACEKAEHSPHPAPPARLRPQLLLHLDLHGRSSALACRASESLNYSQFVKAAVCRNWAPATCCARDSSSRASRTSSVLPRKSAFMAVMSFPVWTSRTKMVRLRIKVEIFFITPVMTRSAPIRCAYWTSQPPQACRLLPSAAAFTGETSRSWNLPDSVNCLRTRSLMRISRSCSSA